MEYALEIYNLKKKYSDFRLHDISFSLPKGYIMGLIGPNGAGKTTIIKLILNLIKKDSGQIKVFGHDSIEQEVQVKSHIGFVHENPTYYDYLSIKKIAHIIAPFYAEWNMQYFLDLCREFELPPGKKIKALSRGMKTKFSLALALCHNADFIVLDEPTAGLDPVFRREFLIKLSQLLQDSGKSILFSTHITSDLERIADYITFINHGKLIFSSTKDDILDRFQIIKGGNDLLNQEIKQYLDGFEKNEFGFQALTSKAKQINTIFKNKVIIEKASLEDIIYYTQKRREHE